MGKWTRKRWGKHAYPTYNCSVLPSKLVRKIRTIFSSSRWYLPNGGIKISILNRRKNSHACFRNLRLITPAHSEHLNHIVRLWQQSVIARNKSLKGQSNFILHCYGVHYIQIACSTRFTSHTTTAVPSKSPRTQASLAVNDPLDSHLDANQKVANALTK